MTARAARPVGRRDRPVAGQEDVDRRVDRVAAAARPSARARASTTSASPPVLAHGSHSAAMKATRIGMAGHRYRARRCTRAIGRSPRSLNRFTCRSRPGMMRRAWTPSASPPSRPPASRCRRGSKACGASPTTCTGRGTRGTRGLCEPDRPAAWARYRNPIPVISGPTDWSRLLDDPELHGRVPRRPRRLRPVHGQRRRPLVPAPLRPRRSTARSPTSAPSTASTSRSGIYSGGLGVLAGDHMKSASDMALPSSASGCSTARATSARRSTPTATRSTTTPTTTSAACRSAGSRTRRATR